MTDMDMFGAEGILSTRQAIYDSMDAGRPLDDTLLPSGANGVGAHFSIWYQSHKGHALHFCTPSGF